MDISDGVRENHSKAGHDYQIIKQPKTYEQQVELIKEKGFIVNNDTECISFLKQANYYRLSAYFLPFRKKNGTYFADISFSVSSPKFVVLKLNNLDLYNSSLVQLIKA